MGHIYMADVVTNEGRKGIKVGKIREYFSELAANRFELYSDADPAIVELLYAYGLNYPMDENELENVLLTLKNLA